MALSRMVIGTPGNTGVTIPAGTFTSDVLLTGTGPTVNGTGSPADFGTGSWAGAASAWAEGFPVTFHDGDVMYLDNTGGGTTGPARLYQALVAAGATLRAFTQNDETGHAALGN